MQNQNNKSCLDIRVIGSYPDFVNKVKQTVLYVGSNLDLTDLFVFESAKTFIHQDLGPTCAPYFLKTLTKHGITDVITLSDNNFRREISFLHDNRKKRLIEYYGLKADNFGQPTDVALFIPSEIKGNLLQGIYMKAVPYTPTVKMTLINILPHLALGGYFVDFPLLGSSFEQDLLKKCGLEQLKKQPRCLTKTVQFSSLELEKILDYSKEKYISEMQ